MRCRVMAQFVAAKRRNRECRAASHRNDFSIRPARAIGGSVLASEPAHEVRSWNLVTCPTGSRWTRASAESKKHSAPSKKSHIHAPLLPLTLTIKQLIYGQ